MKSKYVLDKIVMYSEQTAVRTCKQRHFIKRGDKGISAIMRAKSLGNDA